MHAFLPNNPLNAARKFSGSIGIVAMLFFTTFFTGVSLPVFAQTERTATIRTEYDDYPPGSVVNISGSGFDPGEDVVLQVIHEGETGDNTTSGAHAPWTVPADASGNISAQWTVPADEDELGATLKLTADGQGSGLHAETLFTDAITTTPANATVSADKAFNSSTPDWTPLMNNLNPTPTTALVISEANGTSGRNDFVVQSNKTIELVAPSNWKFRTVGGGYTGITVTTTPASSSEVTVSSFTLAADKITLTINVTGVAQTNMITISGIQVQAQDGAQLGSQQITWGGTATLEFDDPSNKPALGTLTQTSGALKSFGVSVPSSVTAGTAFTATITAKDQFGNTVTSFNGSSAMVDFTTTAGNITPTTSGNFSNGVRSQTNVAVTQVGTGKTITVTRNGGTETGTSNTFTVVAGAVDNFLVEAAAGGNISQQTAGTPFNVKITARDANNNTVTSFTGLVNISSTGTLSGGTFLSGNFTAGVLNSQAVTITNTGNFTITAGTTTTPTKSGTSNSFAVVAGAVDHFSVQSTGGNAIGQQTAGTPFAIKVTAQDANNNTATSFTGTVDISSTGTLLAGGGTTAVFTAGVLASRSVTITNTGNFTITATRTGGSENGTSNAFDVVPGALDHFVVEVATGGSITDQTAGTAFGVKISAKDAFNNTVTAFNGGSNKVVITSNATLTAGGGTSASFTNGVLTTNLTISPGATGVTITATRLSGTETGTSNSFTVNNPVPTITGLSSTSKCAGEAGFTLTVNGTNFNTASVVLFDGVARTTTFVTATQLTAAIPATAIATKGGYDVQVRNPTPGGGTTDALTFTVNDKPSLGTVTAPAAFCAGNAFAATAPTVTANGSTVTASGWQLETAVGNGTYSNVAAGYNVAYADNGKNIRYYATNGCGTTYSNEVAITVNDKPDLSTITAPSTVCSGSNLSLSAPTVTANGSTVSSQGWQLETGVGTGVFNSFTSPYTVMFADNSKKVRYVAINDCGTTYSNEVTIAVLAPVVYGTVASGDETLCSEGNPASISFGTAPSGGAGTFSYQWYYKDGLQSTPTGSSTSGWNLIGDATGSSYDPPSGLTGSRTYAVQVDATGTPDCGGFTWANGVRQVTVNNVTAGVIAGDQTICSGGDPAAFTVITAATGSNTPTYQWQYFDGTDWQNITINGTSATYDVPLGLTATTKYRRVATSTLNSVACSAISNEITVTVNGLPVITPSATAIKSNSDPTKDVQYSDPINPVTIAVTDDGAGSALSISTKWKLCPDGTWTNGLPSNLSLGTPTTGTNSKTWTLSGNVNMAPGTYSIEITVSDGGSCSSKKTLSLIVTPEDARTTYTGAYFTSTSSATTNTAKVNLSATIQDITAVTGDPNYDANAGDIRNARVSFKVVNQGGTTVFTSPTLTPGLVTAGDIKTGTVTTEWPASIGTDDAAQFTVSIIVNNYYSRNSSEDNVVITVAKPVSGLITGGGYTILQSSAGLKAGTAGTKNNFGFNVKNDKNGAPKGTINTIIRKLEDDGIVHVYQIKGNAMNSLSINGATAKTPGTAVFTGKANMQDITDPNNPIAVNGTGNSTLQVTMTDFGEPGKNDRIAITLWNSTGGLLYSNNWNSTQTVEQQLTGGNLKVSTTYTPGTGATTMTVNANPASSTVGQPVTFTATVTQGSGTTKPTGTVAFYDGSKLIGTSTLTVGSTSSSALISTTTLAAGAHTIIAYYGGDSRFNTNYKEIAFMVNSSGVTVANPGSVNSRELHELSPSAVAKLAVKAFPNPAISQFNLKLESNNTRDAITLRVYNQLGQLMDVRRDLFSGQMIQVGANYKQGTYFVEAEQGTQREHLQVVKTN